MFPILVDFGTHDLPLFGRTHLFLPTYGLVFALATVVAWWIFLRRGRALGVAEDALFNLSFYSLLGGILGAKLTLVLVDWRTYLAHPAELLGTLRAAGVLLGGVVGGAFVFVVYARRHGLPLFPLADQIAAPLALAQGFGRLGCFAAGCCWGREVSEHALFSVTFTDPAANDQTGVPLDVPLVPTQLIQMANDLALAGLLAWLARRPTRRPGSVFWLYVLLYSVTRGVIELWRGDTQRGLYFADTLSTSQLIGLGGVVLALFMLARGRRQPLASLGAPARAGR